MKLPNRRWIDAIRILPLLWAFTATPAHAGSRYNVILISIDTLGADHMGAYGYHRATTPFLSELANESVTFENTFSQAPYTLASHYSIFTGVYAETHRVLRTPDDPNSPIGKHALDPKFKTLTEYLKKAGYRTQYAGPVGDSELDLTRGLGRGFDNILRIDSLSPAGLRSALAKVPMLAKGRFFLFLHTYMVHDPYCPAKRYIRIYDPSLPRGIIADRNRLWRKVQAKKGTSGNVTYYDQRDYFLSQFDLKKPADRFHLEALYDGGVRTVDDAMKEVFTTLKREGLFRNTIIIVTSDHGEEFGEHGGFLHINPFHETIHVPLILKIPGFRPKRIKETVLSIDILPTVLELLHIPITSPIEGESLVPLIAGHPLKRKSYMYSLGYFYEAIWDHDWKLVVTRSGRNFLFNLKTDPLEKHDVASDLPQTVEKLRSALTVFKLKRAGRDPHA